MKANANKQKSSSPKQQAGMDGLIWKAPLAVVLIIGIVVLLIGTATPRQSSSSRAGNSAPVPASVSSAVQPAFEPSGVVSTLPTGSTPEPWFYDAAANQHWHAEHGHWHPGPPPPESQRGQAAATPMTVSPSNATPTSAPANLMNPEPWQYDESTNQHWHAGHGHWHPGPPPPPAERDQ